MFSRLGAISTVLALAGVPAFQASAMDIGELEFQNSCVQCHGADGKGGGWMAEYLTKSIPDLTSLASRNNGVFPVRRIYEVIDGTADISVHGRRDMPVWGFRYTVDAFEAGGDPTADFPFDPMEDYPRYVRMRILSLIDYLSAIQE